MVNRVRGIRNHPFRAALACIMKRRQRVSALETAMERIKTRMAKRAQLAAVCALLLAAADADQEPRRAVRRAAGKWRGSTIQGYVVHGDEQTYLENFRCSRVRLQQLVERMSQSPMQRADPPTLRTTRGRSRRILVAARVRDAPDLTFKVAMCLYALGQGGPVKVLADAGSIGRSTLRTWLEMFCDAVTKYVKPIYMPCKPFDGEQLRAVQSQFASRRGLGPSHWPVMGPTYHSTQRARRYATITATTRDGFPFWQLHSLTHTTVSSTSTLVSLDGLATTPCSNTIG